MNAQANFVGTFYKVGKRKIGQILQIPMHDISLIILNFSQDLQFINF